jgi:hypothetical protein
MRATVSCRVRGIVGGVREGESEEERRACEDMRADALYDGRAAQQQAGMQACRRIRASTHTTESFPRPANLSKRAGTIKRRIAVDIALVAFMHFA